MKVLTKKRGKKSKADAAELKKAESSSQFSRQQYLLELAAANQHYLKFRNEQLPEVMDASNEAGMRFISNVYRAYAGSLGLAIKATSQNLKKVDRLAGRLAPEFERRTFLHERRSEFPGRQMFELEPHAEDTASHELGVDNESRHVLIQIRALLKHTVQTIEANLESKEQQMQSLIALHENYLSAGSLVDQSQPKILDEQMQALHDEINTDALQVSHLMAKISRITGAGVDEPGDDVAATPLKNKEVIDLDQAQARELARRQDEATPKSIPKTKKLSGTRQANPLKEVQASTVAASPAAPQYEEAVGLVPGARKTSKKSPKYGAVQLPGMCTDSSTLDEGGYLAPATLQEQNQEGGAVAVEPCTADDNDDLDLPPPMLSPPSDREHDSFDDFTPPPPPLGSSPTAPIEDETSRYLSHIYANTSGREELYEELCQAEVPFFFRALYNYKATQTDDVDLTAGETMYVLVAREDGWCQGLNGNGEVGYFPQSYVEKCVNQDSIKLPRPRIVRLPPSNRDNLTLNIQEHRPPTVDKVKPGSVPYKAGLRKGDMVLEIDEEPCATIGFGQLASWQDQNEKGRTLKLCVVAPNVPELQRGGSGVSIV